MAGGGRLAPERCSEATYKLLLQCWEPDAPLRMVCLWLHPSLPLMSCCQQFDRIVSRIEELVWDVQYPSEDQPQRLPVLHVPRGFIGLIAGADRPRASYLDKLGDMPEFDMTPYMSPLVVPEPLPPRAAPAVEASSKAQAAWAGGADLDSASGASSRLDGVPQYALAVDDWEESAQHSGNAVQGEADEIAASRRASEYLDIPAAAPVQAPAPSTHFAPAAHAYSDLELLSDVFSGASTGWDDFSAPLTEGDSYAYTSHADLVHVADADVKDSQLPVPVDRLPKQPVLLDLDLVPERPDGYLQLAGDDAHGSNPPAAGAAPESTIQEREVEATASNGFAFEQFNGFGDAAQGETDFGVVESYLRSLDEDNR